MIRVSLPLTILDGIVAPLPFSSMDSGPYYNFHNSFYLEEPLEIKDSPQNSSRNYIRRILKSRTPMAEAPHFYKGVLRWSKYISTFRVVHKLLGSFIIYYFPVKTENITINNKNN